MKKLDLKYKLSYQEAYDAFYVLASRRSRRTRLLTGAVLAAISAGMLVMYGLNRTGFHYLFLAVCSIALLFYIIYQPVIGARRGARQVARADGTYHVVLHEGGTIDLPGENGLSIRGDKFSRAVETDTVFAIRIDAGHTVCIPKRILKGSEEDMIRGLIGEMQG